MKVMKDITKKSKQKVELIINNSWWVSELLAADCEKAWLHAGLGDIMQKWYDWLPEVKKKGEVKKMEEEHQKKSQSNDQKCR